MLGDLGATLIVLAVAHVVKVVALARSGDDVVCEGRAMSWAVL
jgi:hypothetical protein